MNTNDTDAEAWAWQALIEAQGGICAFHSMVKERSQNSSGMQGSRTAASKAFHKALQGYRVAFPKQMAADGIAATIEAAASGCTMTCLNDLGGSESEAERSEAYDAIHQSILAALRDAAEVDS